MLARAGMPDEMLNTALLAPKQELTISAGTQNVMSVEIPDFDFKTRTPDQNDMYSYGFAFTTGDLDDTILSLSEVFENAETGGSGKILPVDGGRD